MTSEDPQQFRLPIEGPLSLGDLLDRSFRIYRARFGALVVTAAIILAPIAILSGLATGRFMVNYMDFLQGAMVESSQPPEAILGELFAAFGRTGAWLMLLSLIGLVANAIVTLAATLHVLAFLRGETLTVGEGINRAMRRLPSLLALYIVRSVAIVIAAAVVVTVLVLLIVMFGIVVGGTAFLVADNILGDDNVIAVIGFILFFICLYFFAIILVVAPTAYLSARWLGAVPALVAEARGPIAALQRSWSLTKGNVWRCIGYVVLLSLLSLLVVSLPLGIVQQLLLATLPISDGVTFAISGALASIFNIIWYPLYATGVVLLYYDLRVRRESYDLQLRVDQMEANHR